MYALLECTLLRKIMHSDHSFCCLNVHTSEELRKNKSKNHLLSSYRKFIIIFNFAG